MSKNEANPIRVNVVSHKGLGLKAPHEPFIRTPDPNSFAQHTPNPVPAGWTPAERQPGQRRSWTPGPGDMPSCPVPGEPEAEALVSESSCSRVVPEVSMSYPQYIDAFFEEINAMFARGDISEEEATSMSDNDIAMGYRMGVAPNLWARDWLQN